MQRRQNERRHLANKKMSSQVPSLIIKSSLKMIPGTNLNLDIPGFFLHVNNQLAKAQFFKNLIKV